MGRIKSKLIKRTGRNLLKESDRFSDNFDENKGILRDVLVFKKVRNQIAGHITRIKKIEKKKS